MPKSEYLLPVSILFLFNTVEAQNDVAPGKKKSRQSQAKSYQGSISQSKQAEKQKLFNALRQLNQTKGIYFVFSDKSFGDIMVDPVTDNNLPAEQILEVLLKGTVQIEKAADNTFGTVSQKIPRHPAYRIPIK